MKKRTLVECARTCIAQSLRLSRRAGGRAPQARGAAGAGAKRRLLPLYKQRNSQGAMGCPRESLK